MPETESGTAMPTADAAIDASRRFMAVAERLPTLYALTDEFVQIMEMLEDGVDDAALEERLAQIAGSITHKAESIAGLIAQFESMAAARRAEADRLLARSKTDLARADRLRAYVFKHMQLLEQSRIETVRFTLNIRNNPPAVEVLDETLVPTAFTKTVITTSVDKKAILEHVKATHEVVPGVEIVRRQRLEIR